MRSLTFQALDNNYHIKAWIDLEGNSKTGFFVNNKLDREVAYIDSRMFDWIFTEREINS